MPLNRLQESADRINDFFIEALKAYIFKGDMAAAHAALTAATITASRQRASIVQFARAYTNDLQLVILKMNQADLRALADHLVTGVVQPGQELLSGTVGSRTQKLVTAIEEKNWGLLDAIRRRRELKAKDPEYARALASQDVTVFRRRYPDLP